jgi:hypothetical protein
MLSLKTESHSLLTMKYISMYISPTINICSSKICFISHTSLYNSIYLAQQSNFKIMG